MIFFNFNKLRLTLNAFCKSEIAPVMKTATRPQIRQTGNRPGNSPEIILSASRFNAARRNGIQQSLSIRMQGIFEYW